MNLRQLTKFCESFTSPLDSVLYELERETHLKTLAPQMASGRLQGQFLRFLSLMIREVMEKTDQSWIQDQLMDIEVPEMMGTMKKQVDGFYPGNAVAG